MPNAIDNPGFKIEGNGFEGMAYLQSGRAGPPIATPNPIFSTRKLEIDGRQAWLTSYTSTEPGPRSQKRVIGWTFSDGNDITAQSIHGEFACVPNACQTLETALSTLRKE